MMKYEVGDKFTKKNDPSKEYEIRYLAKLLSDPPLDAYVVNMVGGIGSYTITEKELDEEYSKITPTPTRWRAEKGEEVYYIDLEGRIKSYIEIYPFTNSPQRYFGNYFETEQEAEQARDFFKAWRTLKDDTKGFEWKIGDRRVSVYYEREKLKLNLNQGYNYIFSPLNFATVEDAEASIKNHRKEWLTFFGIKTKNNRGSYEDENFK